MGRFGGRLGPVGVEGGVLRKDRVLGDLFPAAVGLGIPAVEGVAVCIGAGVGQRGQGPVLPGGARAARALKGDGVGGLVLDQAVIAVALGAGHGPAGHRCSQVKGFGQHLRASRQCQGSAVRKGALGDGAPRGGYDHCAAVGQIAPHPQGVGAVDGHRPQIGQGVIQFGGAVHRHAAAGLHPRRDAGVQRQGLSAGHDHGDIDRESVVTAPGREGHAGHGGGMQVILDRLGGHGHGQRYDPGGAGACPASAGRGAGGRGRITLPHRIHRDMPLLLRDKLLPLLQALFLLLLVGFQSVFCLLLGDGQQVDSRVGIDLFAQRDVLHQFHQDKAGNLLFCDGISEDIALVPRPRGVVDDENHPLAATDRGGFALPGHRVGDCALDRALQDIHLGRPPVNHPHPAAGAADPGHHGRCSDVHAFTVIEGLFHVEVDAALVEQDLQLLVFLAQFNFTGFVQLCQLCIVQIDPGIALRSGVHMGAAVQAHVLPDRKRPPAAVGNAGGALRLHQLDRGGCGHRGIALPDAHRQRQEQRQQSSQLYSGNSFHIAPPKSLFC